MKRITNPFVVTGKIPDELFCDRTKELALLESALANELNVVLTSARRMGKTSLIDHALDHFLASGDYIAITVDILQTTSFREFIRVLGRAVFDAVATRSDKMLKLFTTWLKSLSASFGYDPVQNTPTFDVKLGDILTPEYTLGEIFGYLEKVDKRCIVVIDEFQQITRYPEKNIEALLRTHIQKMSNTHFVFSGSRRRLMEEIFFSASRPFFQSAKAMRLEPIHRDIYCEFATRHFMNARKKIMPEAFALVYDTFQGVTFYVQRIMKDAFAQTRENDCCNLAATREIIDDYVMENDSYLREQLGFITETQKELLYAIHAEGRAQAITSMKFNKKHRLRSASSTQSAALKLLEYDLITRTENVYTLTDPLLSLWLTRTKA